MTNKVFRGLPIGPYLPLGEIEFFSISNWGIIEVTRALIYQVCTDLNNLGGQCKFNILFSIVSVAGRYNNG